MVTVSKIECSPQTPEQPRLEKDLSPSSAATSEGSASLDGEPQLNITGETNEIDWAKENADGFAFRDYDNQENERYAVVANAYRLMHENQTHDFVKGMHAKWRKFDKGEFTIMEIITMYIFNSQMF
jgi:hypothetical protein